MDLSISTPVKEEPAALYEYLSQLRINRQVLPFVNLYQNYTASGPRTQRY